MVFVPMDEKNSRVSSYMSSISRRRTNSRCINSSSNTIPRIIHKARHFWPSWIILILQLGQLKLGVDTQSHIGNTQHSQDPSSVSGLIPTPAVLSNITLLGRDMAELPCTAGPQSNPPLFHPAAPRGSVSRAVALYLK